MKSVWIRSFFWSIFFHIRTEYREIRVYLRIQSECGKIRTRKNSVFFFYQGFLSRTLTIYRIAEEGRGTIFYSTLPLPPAHEHSDIHLQLCKWDDYHIFLIAPLVFTRLLLDEIYYLIELPFDWLMIWHH